MVRAPELQVRVERAEVGRAQWICNVVISFVQGATAAVTFRQEHVRIHTK